MRKILLVFSLLIVLCEVQAQALVPLDTLVQFTNTDELQANTEVVRLYNPNSYPIDIEGVDRFRFYGDKIFSVSDSIFTVMPGDTFSLNVSFSPEHNLLHQQALVFKSPSGFGHTVLGLEGQGVYSKSYYASTQNKEQEALKTALSARLALGYTSLGYTPARDQMYGSIDNSGGQVECVYTGRTATFNTRAGANTNSFNCEHTFPQGFFNSNEPMRSDIHHLFPTDVTANSRRGNDPFGVVTNSSWTQGGSKSGGGKFEPRNVQKGATARAMMYFVLRYQDYSNHFSGQETILRQWHQDYPPNSDEQARNAAIYALQNNRNPFVDYPQLIERISSISSTAQSTRTLGLYYSDDTIYLANGNSGLRRFNFIIYGEGDSSSVANNFALSDPNLSFVGGNPGALNLGQGDYVSLEIEFETGMNYNAVLSFDVPGSSVSIPIVSGPQLSLEANKSDNLPLFYPNPSSGSIYIAGGAQLRALSLMDLSGKTYDLKPADWLDLSAFEAGVYILQISLENGMKYQDKLLLKH